MKDQPTETLLDALRQALAQPAEQRLYKTGKRPGLFAAKSGTNVAAVPWALAALTYLDQRTAGGASDPCPLPELFTALAANHPDLSMTDFHNGLRHLRDWHALRLLPFGNPGELPQPEYALLEGDAM